MSIEQFSKYYDAARRVYESREYHTIQGHQAAAYSYAPILELFNLEEVNGVIFALIENYDEICQQNPDIEEANILYLTYGLYRYEQFMFRKRSSVS